MRASVGFNATVVVLPKSTEAAAVARGRGSGSGGPHSAWHSPVPYLFGGLAAMLGLIAFALLILACSYWKLSSFLESEGDLAEESSSKPEELEEKREPVKYEERIVVIMAGEEKPRYLATPSCSRASSFGENYASSSSCSTSSDCGRSNSEVDGKKADDDVIETESLRSNLEGPGYQNQLNQEQ